MVFLRLSAGHLAWLTELRWPLTVLTMLDHHRQLVSEETRAERHVTPFVSGFSADEWSNLQVWMKRAVTGVSVNFPTLLERDEQAAQAFRQLIDATMHRADHEDQLCALLEAQEPLLQTAAFGQLTDSRVRLIVAEASSDLVAAVEKLSAGGQVPPKKRRQLTRTLWALLARSVHKSCPLAFAADTGVVLVRREGPTEFRIGGSPHVVMRPNQELANALIKQLRPVETYLTGKQGLHLNVTASFGGEHLLMWRTLRSGNSVRESLTAIRLPDAARPALEPLIRGHSPSESPEALSDAGPGILRRLVAEGIFAREDFTSPVDADPWSLLTDAIESAADDPDHGVSRRVREAERRVRRFATPQVVAETDTADVLTALTTMRRLGDDVLGRDKIASSSVSVDTFRDVTGDMSADDLDGVRRAIVQYFTLGALAYPLTPTYRKRRAFIDDFRTRYGDDVSVRLESMLINDWPLIDRTLSFLLDPGQSPIHPDSDLVWPEPCPDEDPYAAFHRRLRDAAMSGAASYEIAPVTAAPPTLRSCQPVMDAICRIGRGNNDQLDVYVESATLSGRLVARHLDAVGALSPYSAEATDRYLRETHSLGPQGDDDEVTVLVVASHAVPHLQNLSRVQWAGGPILALTEPVPAVPPASLIRYSELYVRFDGSRQRFVLTRGQEGPALRFSWPSPLSPSFSRRLHLLRFLALAAEPVITAPRWLISEARVSGHMPCIRVGTLALSPQRWSVPLHAFSTCVDATGSRRHLTMYAVRHKLGLPDQVFAYTACDTRPMFVDFASPFGTDVFLRLLRKAAIDGAATVLVEERFPAPGREIVDSPSGSCSMVFRCSLSPGSSTTEGRSC